MRKLLQFGLKTIRSHRWTVAGVIGLTSLLYARKKVPPSTLPYISNSVRDLWYGPIAFMNAPTASNPEGILITNNFKQNIVRRLFPIIGTIDIHYQAVDSLDAILSEIAQKGWTSKVKQFDGSWVPRYVRGSQSSLSSHSYGTSIDLNARDNPRGSPPTTDQALLAPIFEKHGWYWGDRFTSIRDPMHFEYVLEPKINV